ncbi:MAG: hypothetical protein EOO75_15005, partial [Myxococcales bacterium]
MTRAGRLAAPLPARPTALPPALRPARPTALPPALLLLALLAPGCDREPPPALPADRAPSPNAS